jgi:diguanylate cyclase (GGDEF)-like protein
MQLLMAQALHATGHTAAAAEQTQLAAPVLLSTDEADTANQVRLRALVAELTGDPVQALALHRRYQRLQQHAVLAALEARIDELSHELSVQTLRLENAELRSRSEGLAASVRQAERLAQTDALTGLPNRRALEVLWPVVQPQAPAVVAMLDIDHFKAINDTHSHGLGDLVLREVAQIMAASLRAPDHVGRYGGEEFTAVLQGLDVTGALPAMERLRERVQAHDWPALAPGLGVTISLGLAAARPGEGFAQAVSRADALLYEAKHMGRNRVAREAAAQG